MSTLQPLVFPTTTPDVDLDLELKTVVSSSITYNHCQKNVAEIFQVVSSVYIVGRRELIQILKLLHISSSLHQYIFPTFLHLYSSYFHKQFYQIQNMPRQFQLHQVTFLYIFPYHS
jgi:hypothetical protein